MSERRVTVVVADDSPVMRRIVTGVLEGAGFDVVQAEDGMEAVQQHEIEWKWVKGHAGHEMNERADELARAAIAEMRKASV